MFIIIEDDVFDGLEDIGTSYDDTIRAIDELFDSMYKGKHIVFSNIINLNKIKKNELFAPRTRNYVAWLIKEYPRIYSCKSIINKYISTSTSYTKIACNENFYELPLEYFLDANETKLLTEHESDARFYQYIAEYIRKNKKMSPFYSTCFENDSYHGSNGGAKINQVSEGQRCVLCVADTDMDYPKDGKKDTYIGVNNAVKKAKKKIAIELLGLPVREKENLFPANIYKLFTDSDIIRIICDKFSDDEVIANYFDIKEGVKYKKILSPCPKWEGYYWELIKECERQNICDKKLTVEDSDKFYIKGIGDKLCDDVANSLFVWNHAQIKKKFCKMSEEQVNNIVKNRNDILGSIPEFEIRNWELISDMLFDWGCCVDRKKYPAQRNWG